MKTFDEVIQIMEHRRNQQSPLLAAMLEVRQRYHADYVIPLPSMDDEPELPPLTPALTANAIDQPALAAGQILPDVFCPPLDHTKQFGTKSREFARKREHAIKATWHGSKLNLQVYRMFRHMAGYATATLLVRPSWKSSRPIIETRDPLSTYPEPRPAEDMSRVSDVGFIHQRSASWLRSTFPNVRAEVGGPVGEPGSNEMELWDVIEWWDDECTVWGVMGPTYPSHDSPSYYPSHEGRVGRHYELRRGYHGIGHCPVATMPRITLDRVATQVEHQTGIIDFMGRLITLDMIAAERNVFPDRYIIGEPNQMPRIVTGSGNWMDGRTGKTNIIEGARMVGELRSQPDPMTRAAYDTLERNFKVSTGSNDMMSGENGHNLRTGRALSEMYSVAVDPKVMELQKIAEHGLREINESILSIWENCWGDDKVMLFAGFSGSRSVDEFHPRRHVEGSHDNSVSYTIAGADVQQTTIALGQLYGTDAISLDTFRRKHPYIEDSEVERTLVEAERIERAMYDTVLMRAQNGELPLTYLAKIALEVKKGTPIDEAVEKADEMIREQQASAPAEPTPEDPAMLPPEMMPGLEAAGPAAEQMAAMGAAPQGAPPSPSADIGPTEGQVGLDQLLSAMRGGATPL